MENFQVLKYFLLSDEILLQGIQKEWKHEQSLECVCTLNFFLRSGVTPTIKVCKIRLFWGYKLNAKAAHPA